MRWLVTLLAVLLWAQDVSSASTRTSITLTWTPGGGGYERWYRVYRMTGPACTNPNVAIDNRLKAADGNDVFIAGANYTGTPWDAPPTTFVDFGIPTEGIVCYEVTAENYFDESGRSNRVMMDLSAPVGDVPLAPTGLSIQVNR